MLKDPATTYGGRHRPQASDLYRLPSARGGDAALPVADAGRQRTAAPAASLVTVAGVGLLIAGAAVGFAALMSLRLWAAARR
jgi:hypothetical protein